MLIVGSPPKDSGAQDTGQRGVRARVLLIPVDLRLSIGDIGCFAQRVIPMLFRRYPDYNEGLHRRRAGLALTNELFQGSDRLRWTGGDLGWNTGWQAQRAEGLVRIDRPGSPQQAQARLAGSWNTLRGVSDAAVGTGLLQAVLDAASAVARLGRPEFGESEAIHLHDLAGNTLTKRVSSIKAIDISDRVESRGQEFTWGLVALDIRGDIPSHHRFITEQTFVEADARRLALCWNACAAVPLDPLRDILHARVADLVTNAGLAIAAADIAGRPLAEDQDGETRTILGVAVPLVKDRLLSGSFVLGGGSFDAWERMKEMARECGLGAWQESVPGSLS